MRELPALLADTVCPLQDQRASQNQRLATYKETPLSDQLADHAILDLYRSDAKNTPIGWTDVYLDTAYAEIADTIRASPDTKPGEVTKINSFNPKAES